MDRQRAKSILEQAINYNRDGSTTIGNWQLSNDGINAIKVAIDVLDEGIKKEEVSVAKAMKIITHELAIDKDPGSYYYSWQANLACSIMDNSEIGLDKANEIAIKFLNLLIKE